MNNFCVNCGGQIKPGMTVCPNCGTPINNNYNNNMNNQMYNQNNYVPPKKTPLWVIALIIIGVLFVIGVFATSDTKKTTSNSSSEGSNKSSTIKEQFSYTVDKQYADTYTYYLEGKVTNNRNKDYSYLQIEFICYDKDGNNLGTAFDNTNNLLANQTWKYKAMFLGVDQKVDHCDFHEINGW